MWHPNQLECLHLMHHSCVSKLGWQSSPVWKTARRIVVSLKVLLVLSSFQCYLKCLHFLRRYKWQTKTPTTQAFGRPNWTPLEDLVLRFGLCLPETFGCDMKGTKLSQRCAGFEWASWRVHRALQREKRPTMLSSFYPHMPPILLISFLSFCYFWTSHLKLRTVVWDGESLEIQKMLTCCLIAIDLRILSNHRLHGLVVLVPLT